MTLQQMFQMIQKVFWDGQQKGMCSTQKRTKLLSITAWQIQQKVKTTGYSKQAHNFGIALVSYLPTYQGNPVPIR